ncbi:unnamed protein product, partial [Brassica oleracea var. botrytis]
MEAISKNPFVPALKPDQRTTSIGEAAHYSCKMDSLMNLYFSTSHRHESDDVGSGGGEIGA